MAAPAAAPVAVPPSGKKRPPQSILQLAWGRYKHSLAKRPLATKAVTSAAVASLADAVAQRVAGGRYSPARTLKMALWGFCIGAPAAHYWHAQLQRLFAGKRDTLETALQKVVLDQLTFGPLYNLAFMAYSSVVVHGVPPAAFARRVAADFPRLQANGWRVWLPAGLVNYRFVALQYRVLFANFVAFFWGLFVLLSSRAAAGGGAASARVLAKRV